MRHGKRARMVWSMLERGDFVYRVLSSNLGVGFYAGEVKRTSVFAACWYAVYTKVPWSLRVPLVYRRGHCEHCNALHRIDELWVQWLDESDDTQRLSSFTIREDVGVRTNA